MVVFLRFQNPYADPVSLLVARKLRYRKGGWCFAYPYMVSSPFARTLSFDVSDRLLSYIRPVVEAFLLLALMIIRAYRPHRPNDLYGQRVSQVFGMPV